jgi:lipid II:glycine glycyltransferase (peptidoglycan interpeptide bridge formation enzyme)
MENRAPVLTPNTASRGDTFFSQERFIRAVAASQTNFRILKLRTEYSPAHLFGLESVHKFKTRKVWLAPFGLYACPMHTHGSYDCVPDLVAQLKSLRTIQFYWSVRFDHSELADQLERCGLERNESTTQILYLDRPYDAVFRGFSETTRNKIRRTERKGLVVRRATEPGDVSKYYGIYEKLREQRADWNSNYSQSVFSALVSLKKDVIFLLVELDMNAVAGGWFFRDGNSLMYWHGALDYEFTNYFPHYALLNHAVRLATEEGMSYFNMGGSAGKTSLEQFKSFWGARKVPCWWFEWQNPMWSFVSRCRSLFRARL